MHQRVPFLWQYLLPISLLSLSVSAMELAGTPLADGSQPRPELLLTPSLCLLSQEQEYCELKVNLNWNTAQAVCIELDLAGSKRHCFIEGDQTTLALVVKSPRDVHFMLRDPATNQLFAEAVLQVKPLSEPQVRRRFRKPWSMF